MVYLELHSGQNNGPISQNREYRQHRVHCFWAILPILPVSGHWAMILATLEAPVFLNSGLLIGLGILGGMGILQLQANTFSFLFFGRGR